MSVLKVLGIALASTVLASSAALALSVTNRDASSHTVYVQQGENETELSVSSGQSVDAACEEGCIIRLAGVEGEIAAQNADKLVIQDGAIQREQE